MCWFLVKWYYVVVHLLLYRYSYTKLHVRKFAQYAFTFRIFIYCNHFEWAKMQLNQSNVANKATTHTNDWKRNDPNNNLMSMRKNFCRFEFIWFFVLFNRLRSIEKLMLIRARRLKAVVNRKTRWHQMIHFFDQFCLIKNLIEIIS